ncbi:hypothetical protein ACILE2_01570 [Capnocytophaga canimorsus]|uniref:hypothetical protein n=1 Tax=Capnocytophaga canimorsus TaxID=28188 RepID=UPI0037D834F0
MHNKIFDINLDKLGTLLLPPLLRRHEFVAWVRVLLSPLKSKLYDFGQNREGNLNNLQHNSQVCYLRKILNDNFDKKQRRIKILDGEQKGRLYLYPRSYNKSVYLGKIYLHQRGSYIDGGVDFIVQLPQGLNYDVHKLRAMIDFYKLAGKRYTITYN